MFLTRRSLTVIGILLSILLIGGLLTYYIFLSPNGYKAREKADITKVVEGAEAAYMGLDGEAIDLQDFRGTVLIVNVWAS